MPDGEAEFVERCALYCLVEADGCCDQQSDGEEGGDRSRDPTGVERRPCGGGDPVTADIPGDGGPMTSEDEEATDHPGNEEACRERTNEQACEDVATVPLECAGDGCNDEWGGHGGGAGERGERPQRDEIPREGHTDVKAHGGSQRGVVDGGIKVDAGSDDGEIRREEMCEAGMHHASSLVSRRRSPALVN